MIEDRVLGLTYIILGSLSFLSGVGIMLIYILTKTFREPPGMLIFWHILSQAFFDFNMALMGVYYHIFYGFLDYLCLYLGPVNIYFYFLGFNYVICLSIEVLKKMQNPMESNYNKRSKLYHLFSHSLSLIIAVLIAILGYSGPSVNHICLIGMKHQDLLYITAIPITFFLPVMIFTLYVLCKMKFTTSYVSYFITKHSIYVSAYFIIWLPLILNILTNNDHDYFSMISLIMSSSAGFILVMIRMISYWIIKYLKHRRTDTSQGKISIASLINENIKDLPEAPLLDESCMLQNDYFNIFTSISTESALTSILVLQYSLKFTHQRHIDETPPWLDKFYKSQRTEFITPQGLEAIKIPKNLRKHYSSQELEFIEFAGDVFQNIMNLEGISPQDIIQSFDIPTILSDFKSIFMNSGGRSGSFFLYSSDRKFLIKTITDKELHLLLSTFLQSYHVHLYRYQDSIITRILGTFSFIVNNNYKVNFILMQSIFTDCGIRAIYDLKGSKLDRMVQTDEIASSNIVLKDINFLIKQKKLYLTYSVGQRLKEIIENDVKLFRKYEIMDYSLLVAVKTSEEYSKYYFKSIQKFEKGYTIGLIDFLQDFSKSKKFEGLSKKLLRMKSSKEISSINPEDYCKRFIEFMYDIVEGEEKEMGI
ncbi:hypothetical protein SteCoe_2052 [Stentor coeruleus]|uniref:PIPK domain-containing protein n=1 Tax=Stentor coeruleus TaxID=5963 RepID=A0A1R2D0F5_9CILI|nr:hypothetical protein SteCoe_2052 [Stentor coeruleus]